MCIIQNYVDAPAYMKSVHCTQTQTVGRTNKYMYRLLYLQDFFSIKLKSKQINIRNDTIERRWKQRQLQQWENEKEPEWFVYWHTYIHIIPYSKRMLGQCYCFLLRLLLLFVSICAKCKRTKKNIFDDEHNRWSKIAAVPLSCEAMRRDEEEQREIKQRSGSSHPFFFSFSFGSGEKEDIFLNI